MKTSHTLLATTLALMLGACGGGNDKEAVTEQPAPAAPVALNLAEFEGQWVPAPANMQPCVPEFPYDKSRYYRGRGLTLSSTNAILEARHEIEVFSDAACGIKLGLLTEIFTLDPEPVTLADRDKVIRAVPTYSGHETMADNGLGMPAIDTPDGSLTAISGLKTLFDVVGDRLYVNAAQAGVAVDADGFPTDLDPQAYLVRP